MKYYIYHICRLQDKGNLKVGYIGISSNTTRRWKEHRSGNGNAHLKNAYDKYDDIVEYEVSCGSKEEILRMEAWLRPADNIGWNIVKGGGLPPRMIGKDHPLFGVKRPEYIIEAMRVAKIGKESFFKGSNNRWSDEQKSRIGNFHKGKKLSKEHIESISKEVDQFTIGGEFIKRYPSISEAAKSVEQKCSSSIMRVCKGKQKTASGYVWKYVQ